MANKISNFAEGDVNLTAIMQTINAICKGLNILTLTGMIPGSYDVSRPSISAGSVVECNGAIYYFEEDEYIEGDPELWGEAPTHYYSFIKLVPEEDSNGDHVHAEFLSLEVTTQDDYIYFDTQKQGVYDPDNQNHRIIGCVRRDDTDEWIYKKVLTDVESMTGLPIKI